jgi:hypothetical protein
MTFEDDSLDVLKSIVRTAFKYNVRTGLHSSISDLIRIKTAFLHRGLDRDAEEIDFIINFLSRESDIEQEEHHKILSKTREISKTIPIGMLVNFRHCDETLSGELRGFLADRVLVIAKFKDRNKLFEVSPFDLKL